MLQRTMWRYFLPCAALLCIATANLHSQSAAATQEFPMMLAIKADSLLSPHLAEWTERGQFRGTLKNTSAQPVRYRIQSTITLGGNIIFKLHPNDSPLRTLNAGDSLNLRMSDIFPLDRLRDAVKSRVSSRHVGVLTQTGRYSICVSCVDSSGFTFFTKPVCVDRNITAYREPLALFPRDFDTVQAGTKISFEWLGVMPSPEFCVYNVRCAFVGNMLPAQAIRDDFPLLDTNVRNKSKIEWNVPPFPNDMQLVWQVHAKRRDDIPYGDNEGGSIFIPFYVRGTGVAKAPVFKTFVPKQVGKKKKTK
ncbi:MAG: hypothetical protein JNL32_07505 [Candidatus Kapabacteria bacterium]|nr:hypothetical protein [Candidatus Kapabacteria bacterium]